MDSSDSGFFISMNGVTTRIGPANGREWAYHESLIRSDYDRCHPRETFEDLKHRARFLKEDQGLLYDWMAVAAQRAAQRYAAEAANALHMATQRARSGGMTIEATRARVSSEQAAG
jgi:hypothetical protein